jgi:predicted nucleotidyltransferase
VRFGESLSEEAQRALLEAARAWRDLELLVVFGSAARGRLGADSDVDLYVRLVPGKDVVRADRDRFVAAAEQACSREIDLVVERPSTSVILRREAASRGRALFERAPGARRAFVVDAINAYVDLEPQLRKIGGAVRKRARGEGSQARDRLPGGGLDRGG